MAKWEMNDYVVAGWTPEMISNFGKLEAQEDPVNNPSHYNAGTIESIDYIKSFLTKEEYIGFLRGNMAKYNHRARYKGKFLEDIEKAQWYSQKLIETLKETD